MVSLQTNKRYVVFTDGSVSHGLHNKEKDNRCSYAFVIYDTKAKIVYKQVNSFTETKRVRATSNVAEYLGVYFAMRFLVSQGVDYANIYTDSQLVTNHISGLYKCRDENLLVMLSKIQALREKVIDYSVSYIPRGFNKVADKLCYEFLHKKRRK